MEWMAVRCRKCGKLNIKTARKCERCRTLLTKKNRQKVYIENTDDTTD